MVFTFPRFDPQTNEFVSVHSEKEADSKEAVRASFIGKSLFNLCLCDLSALDHLGEGGTRDTHEDLSRMLFRVAAERYDMAIITGTLLLLQRQ